MQSPGLLMDEMILNLSLVGRNRIINCKLIMPLLVILQMRNLESTIVSGTTIPRRSTQGLHSKADHRGKGRFSTQEADGWQKKSQVADQQCTVSTAHYEISSVHGQAHSSVKALRILYCILH